jgi:hypothetical protein
MHEFDLAVVIPCSKTKRACPLPPATLDELFPDSRLARERLAAFGVPARELYLGRQHREMVRAVDSLRTDRSDLRIGLFIVSAGYGVLPENDLIVPYEASIGTTRAQWAARGELLGVPGRIAEVVRVSKETVFGLSAAYLVAGGLPSPNFSTATYLAGQDVAAKYPTASFVLAGRAQAKSFGRAERDIRGLILSLLLRSIAERGVEVLVDVRNQRWHPARTSQLTLCLS